MRRSGEGRYRLLSHTADTGVEATGDTPGSMIAALATGMFESMVRSDPSHATTSLGVTVESPTLEDLVVDVLSELLYRCESEDLVFRDVKVQVDQDTKRATIAAAGVPISSTRPVGPPIKAVTYHRLEVTHDEAGWRGRVYFDV